MSPQGSSKPSPDVYVGLLFISLAAIVAGIGFLVLELVQYAWDVAS